MTASLPGDYTWGFVTGKIIHARGDTTGDTDRLPEATAAAGTVRFTPLERTRKASTALVMHETVTCTIGADGAILDAESQPGVWLITGGYRVEFTLADGSYPAFDIEVTASHTLAAPLDLATVAPYVPSTTPTTTLIVPANPVEGYALGWSGGALAWLATGSGGNVTASQITDSTVTGRAVLTAVDAAGARTAIGAGTSNLALGTTAGTAKAGDYAPDLSGLVPTSRTVAGKALTGDITLAAADLTDFTEASQDVVGAMVAAAGGTYDDAGGSITLPAGGGGGSSTPSFDWMPPSGAWINQQAGSPGPQSYTDVNRFIISPTVLPEGVPAVDGLTVSAGAAQPFAIALYSVSATRGTFTLIRDLGVITPAAIGLVEITLSPSLTLPRLVWVAVKKANAATANAALHPVANPGAFWMGGFPTAVQSATNSYRLPWQATDAAPATATISDNSILNAPLAMRRIA